MVVRQNFIIFPSQTVNKETVTKCTEVCFQWVPLGLKSGIYPSQSQTGASILSSVFITTYKKACKYFEPYRHQPQVHTRECAVTHRNRHTHYPNLTRALSIANTSVQAADRQNNTGAYMPVCCLHCLQSLLCHSLSWTSPLSPFYQTLWVAFIKAGVGKLL